jgi:hypothetical protein
VFGLPSTAAEARPLGAVSLLSAMRWVSRRGNPNGRVKTLVLEFSTDGSPLDRQTTSHSALQLLLISMAVREASEGHLTDRREGLGSVLG